MSSGNDETTSHIVDDSRLSPDPINKNHIHNHVGEVTNAFAQSHHTGLVNQTMTPEREKSPLQGKLKLINKITKKQTDGADSQEILN